MGLTECPNCPAIWTMDEIQEQYCFACGYPNHEEEEEIDEEYDPDEEAEKIDRYYKKEMFK